MAMKWVIRVVSQDDAELGTGTFEPFAVVEDENGDPLVVVKGLVEDEGEKSSTRPENNNWAGRHTTEGELP